jgi:membrane protein required for colicin V production
MNYIDMFIIVLLVWAVYRGYTRGFIMQLTLLVALVLGIFLALKLSGFTARQLENHINTNAESLYLVSLGITFVAVFFGINLIGKLFEKMAKSAQLSFINRIFGVLFSLGKTILLLGILLAFIDRIDQRLPLLPKNTHEHSIFYKPFTSIARTLFPSLGTAASNDRQDKEFVGLIHT